MDFEGIIFGKGQPSDAPLVRPSIDIRILVVDDDTTTLAIVSSMLQIFNYKVETAKNPLDALATLRMQSGFFDLVLTDLHMPYMNGFELQKQVDKEFKLPVIMMTADDKENLMLESLEKGIVLFLPKPVKPDDLKEVWQYALRSKKGKSIMIEEIETDPNPRPLPIIDLSGDDEDNNDENQGPQPLCGPGSTSLGNAGSLVVAGAAAGMLIPRNQLGKRGNRSPPKDGNKKGSTSTKKPCVRLENWPPTAPAAHHRRPRKPKIVWTNSLHNRFLLAIKHLTVDKAVPKRILEFMNVPGLTRENVASHLQKYRLFLKKVAKDGIEGARMLADQVLLRSSFATGYPTQMMSQNAERLYPQAGKPSQEPPALPPAPQSQSQSQSPTSLAPNNNIIPSSSALSSQPVGISALLTDNQPAANVVQQPLLGATSAATRNVVGGGGVNLMQAWQQQNQASVGPFAGTTYPSNVNNFGGTSSASVVLNPILTVGSNVASVGNGNNYVTSNNSAGGGMINGGQMDMAGSNQPSGGAVSNGTNGGGDRVGMANGADGGSSSGLLLGANNPQAQTQPNANAVQPPPPPRTQRAQKPRRGSANSRRPGNNKNDNAENEPGNVADKNVPIFDENGLLLNLDNLPSPNYEALIEQIPSELSDTSIEDNRDQVSPPTNQAQNPDPFAAGPSGVPENVPNLEQSLGLQGQGTEQALLSPGGNVFPSASNDYFPLFEIPIPESHMEDVIFPFQIMNIENLHREVDWDEFMDAMLQDDCGEGPAERRG